MKQRRFALNLVSAVVGAALGAAGVLALGGITDGDTGSERRPRPVTLAEPNVRTPVISGTVLLGWAPGGLPANTEQVLEATAGVRHATTVIAGLDWIETTRAADGSVVDRPEDGFRIPFETAVIEPREYARFVSPVDRPLIEALGRGDLLLAQSAAGLRRGDQGMTIRFDGRTDTVAGTISDDAANGYEGMMRGPVPATWMRADRFVLVKTANPNARARVQAALRSVLAPGQVVRVRAQGETPFLRYGDAVLPQMLIKNAFGEFAARPLSTGSIQIQRGWVRRNIDSARVPVLGKVICHRALFPQLR
ncbi:MAG TPA: hypothetical protein VIG64_02520, partial [Actinomycetota bacterium]